MRIVYRGNHSVSFATEQHVAASMRDIGHEVLECQENEVGWDEQVDLVADADVFWWTSTYGYAQQWDQADAAAAVAHLNQMLPTVSFHLDIWHGLPRAEQVATNPFFRTRHVYTADGGHDPEWAALGIQHRWLVPGVYAGDCHGGVARPDLYGCEVAFVGNWKGYHPEHPGRREMVRQLRRRYGHSFRTFPESGGPAIREQALRDLYATVPVLVGDSCFGGRVPRYWSDRIPETLGRGAYLVHPAVQGLWEHFEPGMIGTFAPDDWAGMFRAIEHALADPETRVATTKWARDHVLQHHTYAVRVQRILDDLRRTGALAA